MYLEEHRDEFPGVEIVGTYLRDYEYRALAAQVLGYVGEISPEELERLEPEGYRAGEKIGKTGIESAFDRYLRGHAGAAQLRVDSLGRPQGAFELRRPAQPGNTIRLTLDIGLQRAAERALSEGIDLAYEDDRFNANGGAIVALDPRDGAVLAMARTRPTSRPSTSAASTRRSSLRSPSTASRSSATTPGSTARSPASTRPAPRSSRSPPSPRSRTASSRRTSTSSARRTPSTGSTSTASTTGTRTRTWR